MYDKVALFLVDLVSYLTFCDGPSIVLPNGVPWKAVA